VAGIDLSGIDTSIIKTLTYLLVLQPIGEWTRLFGL
jgi:hypothetical protein